MAPTRSLTVVFLLVAFALQLQLVAVESRGGRSFRGANVAPRAVEHAPRVTAHTPTQLNSRHHHHNQKNNVRNAPELRPTRAGEHHLRAAAQRPDLPTPPSPPSATTPPIQFIRRFARKRLPRPKTRHARNWRSRTLIPIHASRLVRRRPGQQARLGARPRFLLRGGGGGGGAVGGAAYGSMKRLGHPKRRRTLRHARFPRQKHSVVRYSINPMDTLREQNAEMMRGWWSGGSDADNSYGASEGRSDGGLDGSGSDGGLDGSGSDGGSDAGSDGGSGNPMLDTLREQNAEMMGGWWSGGSDGGSGDGDSSDGGSYGGSDGASGSGDGSSGGSAGGSDDAWDDSSAGGLEDGSSGAWDGSEGSGDGFEEAWNGWSGGSGNGMDGGWDDGWGEDWEDGWGEDGWEEDWEDGWGED
ncbi:unnamed protein product [Closterium sp. NIES-53]